MAKANLVLIQALRKTAKRMRTGTAYQWGHFGSCNCGHLVQTLTNLTKGEIHAAAKEKNGDWGDLSRDFCSTSGFKIDKIIKLMLQAGLNIEDIENLENLGDRKVLSRMKIDSNKLKHNRILDVVAYMEEWADLLESELNLDVEKAQKITLEKSVVNLS
tara:strand:+ start:290 stop:766 length:477 start_codon:yes stop_codon:yes gene_type:complete